MIPVIYGNIFTVPSLDNPGDCVGESACQKFRFTFESVFSYFETENFVDSTDHASFRDLFRDEGHYLYS